MFFVNSYQNGATSWIPNELPPCVKIVITITRDPIDAATCAEVDKFIECCDDECLMEIGDLGNKLSEQILARWLRRIKRHLTNHQWRVVLNALDVLTLPLFVTLIFAEIERWKSYSLPQETTIPETIEKCIHNLFEQLENKFGFLLVGHAVGYITASKSGLSESELEDILCLDDRCLEEVFQYHIPEGKRSFPKKPLFTSNSIPLHLVRRIPPILWTKIRRELQHHFTENEADGVRVLVWAHRQVIIINSYQITDSLCVLLV